jgi:molybdopterin converting factor small subunit
METLNVDYANVNILLFAKAKELVRKPSMLLKLPTKFSGLDSLLERVETEIPELKILNRCFVLALNEEYLIEDCTSRPESNEIILKDQDELAVIPPLSGG